MFSDGAFVAILSAESPPNVLVIDSILGYQFSVKIDGRRNHLYTSPVRWETASQALEVGRNHVRRIRSNAMIRNRLAHLAESRVPCEDCGEFVEPLTDVAAICDDCNLMRTDRCQAPDDAP